MKIARRMTHASYAIREVVARARKVAASGRNVLSLNIGNPNAYDFDCPDFLKNYLIEALNDKKNNGYAESEGLLELRQAVSECDLRKGVFTGPENVLVTSGLSEAMYLLSTCLIEKGRTALLPSPCYPLYTSVVGLEGGKNDFYSTPEDAGFSIDVDDLRKKLDDKTAFVLLNSPSNPTGVIYSERNVKNFLDVCAEFNVTVLSDEIYDELVFEGKAVKPASLCKDVPIVSMNGLSKNFSAPGWRLGWLSFNNFKDEELKESVLKLCQMRLSASLPAQVAAAKSLNHPGFKAFNQEMVGKLRKRRDLTFKRLNEIPGLSCVKPNGAFYAFPKIESNAWKDDKEFVYQLLEEAGVLTVYGSGFKAKGKHFRIAFLPEERLLSKAFDGIEEFMRKHA